jgi:glycosyltransferase involved in cell wall biosynthesis
MVRPVGHHRLNIAVFSKYCPFKSIRYASGDADPHSWNWLPNSRLKIEKLPIRPILGIDPIYLRDGTYRLTSWALLDGLEKVIIDADFVDTAELNTFFSRQCATLAHKHGKKLVTTVVETIPWHISTLIPPYSWNTRFVAKQTDLFVVPTRRSQNFLLSIGVEESKVKVIPFGVDVEFFAPRSAEKSDEKTRILFVSPLISKRGLPELLLAFSELCRTTNQVELWVCGDGPLRGMVSEHSRKYPIKYLGDIQWTSMPEIYRQCDIFCLPGRDIFQFGIKVTEDGQYTTVVLEAMASGLPVIVSDSGAYRELVGPENLVVRQRSVRELLSALELLMADRAKRRRVAQSNRKRAFELFNGRRQCKEYASALMEIAN